MPVTITYWDDLSRAEVEAALTDVMWQPGKAKVREHPMPGYSPTASPFAYTPERVLKELINEVAGGLSKPTAEYTERRANQIIARLKKHGFEITPIIDIRRYPGYPTE